MSLPTAATALEAIGRTGVDALIVQDIGIAQLARRILPEMELHGSTQMSITSAEGVALAQRFGVTRVVLARELSLDEVRAYRRRLHANLRCSSMALSASPTRGSASPPRRGVGAAPTAVSVRRLAACPTN